MTHTWKAGGSNGAWVHHNGGGGSGTDSIGVGLGEDVLGPFIGSQASHLRTVAEVVADALQNAYAAGLREGRDEWRPAAAKAGKALGEIREAAARVIAADRWDSTDLADALALLGDELPDGMLNDYRADLAAENRVQTSEELDAMTARVQAEVARDIREEQEDQA